MSRLDDRFGTVLRMMRESSSEGERDAARSTLQGFARKAGLSLEAAIAKHSAPTPQQPAINIFAGFDDWMEEREPGFKAKKATERADKISAWKKRKADLIHRGGSVEAIVAPCEREKKLLASVKPWRKVGKFKRWTESLDGWRDWDYRKAPPHVLEAIRNAYALPATFYEARDEVDYWNARNQELEDVLTESYPPIGDTYLDLVADIRLSIVRDLANTEMFLGNLGEVLARFEMAQSSEVDQPALIAAVYRDLRRLVTGTHT